MSETYNFDILQHFSKFTPLPLLNFWVNPKLDNIPLMCILLKLDYAKIGVSNLFLFPKVIEENLWGLSSPSLVKEGLHLFFSSLIDNY